MAMEIFVAEIVGTAVLCLFGCGVVANELLRGTKGEGTGWLMINTGWGFAVALAVYTVGRISGAHLNPAVTMGLFSIGQVETNLLPAYLGGQMVGAFLGAVLTYLAYLSHWSETSDQGKKLGVFATAPEIRSTGPNLLCEAIGTAALVFGVLAIGENAGEMVQGDFDLTVVFSTAINPMLVGVLVFAIGMSLGGPTGYAINPARDLGPRIAHALLPIPGKGSSDWSYAWIPVVGPLLGGVAGALLFDFIFG